MGLSNTDSDGYSILLIIDVTGSMASYDPENLVTEIAKMLVASVYGQNTELGFIAFTDRIVYEFPIMDIGQFDFRRHIKSRIDALTIAGSTDIGRAVRHGVTMLADYGRAGNQPIVVLLTDGAGTNLTHSRVGRTVEDSHVDMEYAIDLARRINVPIHTVSVNMSSPMDVDDHLLQLSNDTNGRRYFIQNANALPYIFGEILSEILDVPVLHNTEILLEGGRQLVSVDIIDFDANEVNIIFHHDPGVVNDVVVFHNYAEIYTSARFTSITVSNHHDDEVLVSFLGEAGYRVHITAANHTMRPEFDLSIYLPDGNPAARQVVVRAVLDESSVATRHEFDVWLILSQQGIVLDRIPMSSVGNHFEATFQNRNPGYTDITVTATDRRGRLFSFEMENVLFTNNAPLVLSGLDVTVLNLPYTGQTLFDLNDFFIDEDGGNLSFALVGENDATDITIYNDYMLSVSPSSTRNEFIIAAYDDRGGRTETTFIAVVPFAVFYRIHIIIGLIATVVVLVMVCLYLLYNKNKTPVILPDNQEVKSVYTRFNNTRFEGYFLNTKSGNEIPVLFWNASHIENRNTVSLGELLRLMEVDEDLPESDRIFFNAGNNNSIVFSHDTNCIVTIKNQNIPRSKRILLQYDDKIYITFENHATELEVRYKRTRKRG